jgi:hypothetical protein
VTLSTNIYVLDECTPHELFRFCQTLLTKYDEQGRTWREQHCSDEPRKAFFSTGLWSDEGRWSISNEIGQGLPAILDIEYRPGAMLWTPAQAAECDDDCDEGCDKDHYFRACWLNIDFDTAYSYRGPNGIGCGGLHALLVAEVGNWLDARGLAWEWRNEFTGEVHGGETRYAQLLGLADGGRDAAEWFTGMVKPAIEAMAAEHGSEVEWS